MNSELSATAVKASLASLANEAKARQATRFFKTAVGQYGHGDQFIGLTVPEQRQVAKTFKALPEDAIIDLLHSPVHEHRLTALFIMVGQYIRGDDATKDGIASLYIREKTRVNNWDLVDSSAPSILGDYIMNHPNKETMLDLLADSVSLWDRRIAIVATFAWLRHGESRPTLKMAEKLLNDPEDLINKAVGWALREMGKSYLELLTDFLNNHAATMPRVTLRYAIEHLDANQKQVYMSAKASSI